MTPSDEDRELFRKAVEGARPLPQRKHAHAKPAPPPPRARFRRADEAAVLEESLASNPEAESDTGEDLSFRRPSIGLPVFRKLKRGEISVRDEIDLHGLTAAEARPATRAEDARQRAQRSTQYHKRTGQGQPVMKYRVEKLLAQLEGR